MKKELIHIGLILVAYFLCVLIGWNSGKAYQEKKCWEDYLSISTFMGGSDHSYVESDWESIGFENVTICNYPLNQRQIDSLYTDWIVNCLEKDSFINKWDYYILTYDRELYLNGVLLNSSIE